MTRYDKRLSNFEHQQVWAMYNIVFWPIFNNLCQAVNEIFQFLLPCVSLSFKYIWRTPRHLGCLISLNIGRTKHILEELLYKQVLRPGLPLIINFKIPTLPRFFPDILQFSIPSDKSKKSFLFVTLMVLTVSL